MCVKSLTFKNLGLEALGVERRRFDCILGGGGTGRRRCWEHDQDHRHQHRQQGGGVEPHLFVVSFKGEYIWCQLGMYSTVAYSSSILLLSLATVWENVIQSKTSYTKRLHYNSSFLQVGINICECKWNVYNNVRLNYIRGNRCIFTSRIKNIILFYGHSEIHAFRQHTHTAERWM